MSSPLLNEIRETGFAVVPGLIDAAEARDMRERVLSLTDRQTATPWDLPSASVAIPELNTIRTRAPIRELVSEHCGRDAKLLIDMITIRGPEDQELHWHTDTAVWVPPPFANEARVLTVGVCFDNVSSGGTRFIVDSHRQRNEPELGFVASQSIVVEPTCAAGDVLVWLGETWHGRSQREFEGERIFYVCAYGNENIPTSQRPN